MDRYGIAWVTGEFQAMYNELSFLENNHLTVPQLNAEGEYIIYSKTLKANLVKIDKHGYIHINPRIALFHYYEIYNYFDLLLGLHVHFMHRYKKYRLYISNESTRPYYRREYHSSPHVQRYIYDIDQEEDIVMDFRGYVISGAKPYVVSKYQSQW